MSDLFGAGEQLLGAWLSLTSTLWNTRLVSSMTYNECHILGILLRHKHDAVPQTATDLIARTHLLKSQMNKILTTLESKCFITRERASGDRRMVHIRLAPAGEAAYIQEHAHIDTFLKSLIDRIGESKALCVAEQLNEITGALSDLLPQLNNK